jgi:HEAT repeat protein
VIDDEQDTDPHGPGRRRRQAVVAGHDGDGDNARRLADDTDPTVRSAALGALARLGALDDGVLLRGLADPDPMVRRRACALAGRGARTGRPNAVVVAGLAQATDDTDASVVEMASWALGEWGRHCTAVAVARLSRVAGSHDSPVCREAAVAALGAVGAPDSLPVVLTALDDTVNIRRRAAIALAAFDDPRAEAGLRRCRADRDWQVRQAAEELLTDG